MNHAASRATIIADRYLAIWNERDDITRRARIAQLFVSGRYGDGGLVQGARSGLLILREFNTQK